MAGLRARNPCAHLRSNDLAAGLPLPQIVNVPVAFLSHLNIDVIQDLDGLLEAIGQVQHDLMNHLVEGPKGLIYV